MKRVLCLLFACALCCWGFSALAVEGDGAAGAADPSGVVTVSPAPSALPQPFQVEVTLIDGNPVADVTPTPDPTSAPVDNADSIMEVLERIDTNTQTDAPGTSSGVASVSTLDPEQADREGLAGVVSSIFGVYTPRTYTTSTYIGGEVVTGMEIVPGLAGLDWPWLCGAVLFGIMLFCLFRLLGGIWK